MGYFRFRKTFSILPGVRVNLSKTGVSSSIGGHGATVNVGKNGPMVTLGIPGTGLSYRTPVGLALDEAGGREFLADARHLLFRDVQELSDGRERLRSVDAQRHEDGELVEGDGDGEMAVKVAVDEHERLDEVHRDGLSGGF